MLSVIDTIRVKLFIIPSPYSVSSTPLYPHFHTHLIYPNEGFSIIHSEMSMALSKLETRFPVKFLEKGTASGYLMIIAKGFESAFEGGDTHVKLKVFHD
jgi:hypothetical protein